jgi:hypothetical protein
MQSCRNTALIAALLVAVLLASTGGSMALAFHGNQCDEMEGPIDPNRWRQTAFSYTDWSGWGEDAGKGYDAERISTGGVTYFHDMPNGGWHAFDNGSFSPWRKTSFFNYNSPQPSAYQVQGNDNGTCL